MNASHLFAVYQAEVERLFRRGTAILGLVLSALFGFGGPALIGLLNYAVIAPRQAHLEAEVGATEAAAIQAMEGSAMLGWDWSVLLSFYTRNLMFLPVLIFLLGGLSMASEFSARTTREDVLRPIARWQLLLCKWAALLTWITAAIALTAGISSLLGLLLNGGFTFDETLIEHLDDATLWTSTWAYLQWAWSPIGKVVTQLATTFVMDLGFASVALCIAVVTRSVSATVASLVMVFTVQIFAALGLALATSEIVENVVQQQAAWLDDATREAMFGWFRFLALWQPPFVLGTCDVFSITTPWQSFVTLAVITVVALIAAVARFETMDVP